MKNINKKNKPLITKVKSAKPAKGNAAGTKTPTWLGKMKNTKKAC